MPLTDVTVVEGEWKAERPTIILDAALVRRAIANGELHDIVLDCLAALDLSGKLIVHVAEDE